VHVADDAVCDDANICTDDQCDLDKGCILTPNNSVCTDNNLCTNSDICVAGTCQPGPALDCDDGNQCTNDTCETQTGCKHTPVADGTACGVGGTWTCQAGVCTECVTPHGNKTFNYTGGQQSFNVPNCVKKVTIEAWGAQGGGSPCCSGSQEDGGKGGYAKGDLAVTPGETLYVYVGKKGTMGGAGGWNGGGGGGQYGGGGGGASDVRKGGASLNDRKLVGGGAGAGNCG